MVVHMVTIALRTHYCRSLKNRCYNTISILVHPARNRTLIYAPNVFGYKTNDRTCDYCQLKLPSRKLEAARNNQRKKATT